MSARSSGTSITNLLKALSVSGWLQRTNPSSWHFTPEAEYCKILTFCWPSVSYRAWKMYCSDTGTSGFPHQLALASFLWKMTALPMKAKQVTVFTGSRLCAYVLHWYGQHAHGKVAHWAAFLHAGKVPASGNAFMETVTDKCTWTTFLLPETCTWKAGLSQCVHE